jgi:RNA polymerase sigma-70 factor (ECF subfamily)
MNPLASTRTPPLARPIATALEDSDLRRQLQQQALGQLAKRLADYPATRRQDEAEEIVSQTIMRALSRQADFDPERGEAGAWLHGILVNVCSEHCRKLRKLPAHSDYLENIPAKVLNTNTEEVDAILARLSADERRIVEAIWLRECPHRVVADELGITEGTARQRLRRALSKLQRMMAREVNQ